MLSKPNILYLMCDQFRFDCIAALGNCIIRTPNIDRLVARGVSFTNAYSTCPVCIPARYTVCTGREPYNTGCYENEIPVPMDGLPKQMEDRCGAYLARTMSNMGYRTFGIGKFHTFPRWNEDLGFDVHLHTEELWGVESRSKDAYASFIAKEHPEYDFIEQLHGERTDMYYMPQTSSLPAKYTVESFVADKAIEQINIDDRRPYFGFVSFIGPHPPFAPPIPYNRMYNPDIITNPVCGNIETDHMDEQIPFMNHTIWGDEINDFLARSLKSHYFGEITYIDDCIGRILDAVEARPDADNTVICFFADHGDHMGDHHAWQKESYFEAACHVPFLVSWPKQISQGKQNDELVCLTDLFGIATTAAGSPEIRDGVDILGILRGISAPRETLFACYGRPETPLFKVMVRKGDWKYIFISNGNREQLFNLKNDPHELSLENETQPQIMKEMRRIAIQHAKRPGLYATLDGDDFKIYSFKERELFRIRQFDSSRGVNDFIINKAK
jgi:arylsulfatase